MSAPRGIPPRGIPPRGDVDSAGYLANGRPSVERFAADADARADRAHQLPERLAAITGWAESADRSVRVTVNSLGELIDLDLSESVMRHGADEIATHIMELSALARRAATIQAITELAPVIGDAATLKLARQLGLDDLLGPDAPVIEWRDHTAPSEESSESNAANPPRSWQHEQDELSSFDFSQFRSDR